MLGLAFSILWLHRDVPMRTILVTDGVTKFQDTMDINYGPPDLQPKPSSAAQE